jgi:hypothetical protein
LRFFGIGRIFGYQKIEPLDFVQLCVVFACLI